LNFSLTPSPLAALGVGSLPEGVVKAPLPAGRGVGERK